MAILYIYIGTVIVAIAVDIFSDKYVEKEVENRGYQFKKEPKNIYKSIICGIKNYVHFFIPIWNLCLASYEFSKIDKICEDFIEQSILNGDLIKK